MGGNTINKEIGLEVKRLENELNNAKREISLLPKGKLRCTSSNGSDQYFIDGTYISKKKLELIQKVAQREYYEKLIPVLEENLLKLKAVESMYENHTLEKCFEDLCRGRKKLVNTEIESLDTKIRKFMKEKYEPGIFSDDDRTEFYTIPGERVRSKSEMIIADELYRYHIPYHYEMPLELNNWGKIVTCRPDFTVMSRSEGKKYIYEHFGMMDNPDYAEKNMKKLDLYEKNGYILGKNLIITHETSKSPLIIGVIDTYIEHYFL